MEKVVRVAPEKVGRVVGTDGKVKKRLERDAGVRLKVTEDSVVVKSKNSLNILKARDVIRAIDLGFSTEQAFELLEDTYQLRIIELSDVVSESHLERVCGRIIGHDGKTKKRLEDMLGVYIAVDEDRVAAIGDPMDLKVFREAIDMFVRGVGHSHVYRHIDEKRSPLQNL